MLVLTFLEFSKFLCGQSEVILRLHHGDDGCVLDHFWIIFCSNVFLVCQCKGNNWIMFSQ
jgi:hypothetical protein